jgi:hypothetical protein
MKTITQFVAFGSGVFALCLGIWLQQMPPAMIGSYWQCDAMTLLTILSIAAQLTAMLISKNDALKQPD